ncbi:hypothetical protein, partial [Chimaeribacter californicus]|uniref:hypothetical protein n=1 Tax=Chimaeribacter californicus TaxID=2060067 RepID=UPI0019D49E30
FWNKLVTSRIRQRNIVQNIFPWRFLVFYNFELNRLCSAAVLGDNRGHFLNQVGGLCNYHAMKQILGASP